MAASHLTGNIHAPTRTLPLFVNRVSIALNRNIVEILHFKCQITYMFNSEHLSLACLCTKSSLETTWKVRTCEWSLTLGSELILLCCNFTSLRCIAQNQILQYHSGLRLEQAVEIFAINLPYYCEATHRV